jgi:hypothetical protein
MSWMEREIQRIAEEKEAAERRAAEESAEKSERRRAAKEQQEQEQHELFQLGVEVLEWAGVRELLHDIRRLNWLDGQVIDNFSKKGVRTPQVSLVYAFQSYSEKWGMILMRVESGVSFKDMNFRQILHLSQWSIFLLKKARAITNKTG